MRTDTAVIAECRLRDRSLQAIWCARRVADLLADSLACSAEVSLAVSGGRSPVEFLRRLSELPLDWRRIVVTLVDERWVDPASSDSNERLVRDNLLRAEAAGARFVPLKNAAATPEQGAGACNEQLAAMPWPLTVTVLGMGDDGHTASLFPDADGLDAAMDPQQPLRALAVRPPLDTPPRMTLSLAALRQSRHAVLMIAGDEKWRVYREAVADDCAQAVRAMPVRGMLFQHTAPLEVYWAP